MTQKLESLTPEQTALMEVVANEWKDFIFSCSNRIDKEAATKGILDIYAASKLEAPQLAFVGSPLACQYVVYLLKKDFDKNGAITQEDIDKAITTSNAAVRNREQICRKEEFESFSAYCNISDYGWVSFYDYFTRIGVLNDELFNNYKTFIRSGVYDTIQMDKVCAISSLPVEINRDSENRLHCLTGPAILFEDSYCQYYVHGRHVPTDLFEKFLNGSLVKEDFMKETNEDIRAAIFELVESKQEGNMLAFLGADTVSEEVIVHKNGDLETLTLYKTKELFPELQDLHGNQNVPLCWLRLVCPSTGTRYLISSDSSFKTASEAAKFHRPSEIPLDLDYKWDARS